MVASGGDVKKSERVAESALSEGVVRGEADWPAVLCPCVVMACGDEFKDVCERLAADNEVLSMLLEEAQRR